ncbi:MAG: hypothetical protein ACOYMG_19110 [Candidatus Methylumidiphilus sp.]
MTDRETLTEQQALWERARKNTPHGVPLALENAYLDPHDHDHDHHHGEIPVEELLRPMTVCTNHENIERL